MRKLALLVKAIEIMCEARVSPLVTTLPYRSFKIPILIVPLKTIMLSLCNEGKNQKKARKVKIS